MNNALEAAKRLAKLEKEIQGNEITRGSYGEMVAKNDFYDAADRAKQETSYNQAVAKYPKLRAEYNDLSQKLEKITIA